jgi:AcrR family transcriptional regulator
MATARRSHPGSLREEQARVTRRRVIDAARNLFLGDGYTATTIDAIARAAGVSVQTVYNAVGNKAAVLRAVYDTTLAGDDARLAVGERPSFHAVLSETSGRRCLARYAALGREIGERVLPVLARISAEAGNPDIRDLADIGERQRAEGTATVARHVADLFGLAPGLTVDEAADILWTLTGPEAAIRLVQQRGWTWDRYEAWLAAAMADGVLGDEGPASPT